MDQLLEIGTRSASDPEIERPKVTLLLRSGQSISGRVVSAKSEATGRSFLLWDAGANPSQPSYDAVFVEVSSIEAVRVHQAAEIAHLLSPELIRGPAAAAPLTRLEVTKRAADRLSFLQQRGSTLQALEVDWQSVPTDENTLSLLHEAIRNTGVAWVELMKTAVGKSTLDEKISKIRFARAQADRVTLEGGTLSVLLVLNEVPPSEKLRSWISACL